MKRIMLAVLVVASLFASSSRAASAQADFDPNPNSAGSCGFGREGSQFLRALSARPGASEARDLPPVGVCTGN